MPPRIKLFTVWCGPLPVWIDQFVHRVECNPILDWELVLVTSPNTLNKLASGYTGVECAKSTVYSQCDLRPLFGGMFHNRCKGYEWWGWCDLDIVIGDLNTLLPPLLDTKDVISSDYYTIAGPLSLLRNCHTVNNLWELGAYKEVLADPTYRNWDEGGRTALDVNPLIVDDNCHIATDAGGFTRLVHTYIYKSRIQYDDRSWCEGRGMVGDTPQRTCTIDGNKLIELPTNRELIRYHFGTKIWPIDKPHQPTITPKVSGGSGSTNRWRRYNKGRG